MVSSTSATNTRQITFLNPSTFFDHRTPKSDQYFQDGIERQKQKNRHPNRVSYNQKFSFEGAFN